MSSFLYIKYFSIKLLGKRNFRRQVYIIVLILENLEIIEIDKKFFFLPVCLGFILMTFSLAFAGRTKHFKEQEKKNVSFKVQYK